MARAMIRREGLREKVLGDHCAKMCWWMLNDVAMYIYSALTLGLMLTLRPISSAYIPESNGSKNVPR
jgi:hypothetical protein